MQQMQGVAAARKKSTRAWDFIVVVEPIALLELVKSLVLLCPSLLRHVVHMED